MRWTKEQLNEYERKQAKNSGQASRPVMERIAGNEPLAQNQGKASGSGFVNVVVTSFRRRLLDEDNLACKWHVDALRYSGILLSDAPDKVSIKAKQQKVKSKEEERTEIEIEMI